MILCNLEMIDDKLHAAETYWLENDKPMKIWPTTTVWLLFVIAALLLRISQQLSGVTKEAAYDRPEKP